MNKIVIELGGKERTLKFNNIFAREYEKKKLEYDDDVSNLCAVLYAGIKAYSVVSETKMQETFEECCDLAEDMILNHPDKIQEIIEAFQESNFYKAAEEVKKKMAKLAEPPIGIALNGMLMANSV